MRALLLFPFLTGCFLFPRSSEATGQASQCLLETSDTYGPAGTVPVRTEVVASGLEVPWGIAFLPGGDALVTERPGRVRLLRGGQLVAQPVAHVPVSAQSESGLLGIAVHPKDASLVYLYLTAPAGGNSVERWKLSPDRASSAALDKVIFEGIASAALHDGGRIHFGPDGMLYVGTGDARSPDRAQDLASPNGKILRLTPEGAPAEGNPTPGNPVLINGIRNTQGFDWLDAKTLAVADHGPSGEFQRYGHDELNVATAGANLGWPGIYGCESRQGWVSPVLTWERAVPPGGVVVYRGSAIPEWKDNVLLTALGAEHLHRVVLGSDRNVKSHEVYFAQKHGRLREIVLTPQGELWMTTSNCDGRGECPPQKDVVLRVLK